MSAAKKKTKKPSPVAKLRPFLSRRKLPLTGAIATSVAATLLGLVPYWIVYQICVGLAGPEPAADSSRLFPLALTALGAIVAKGLLAAWSANWTHQAAYAVVHDVRMALAEKLAKLPLGYFDRNDSGKIKHTMSEDVEQLEEGIAHLLPDITSSAALPALSFLIMFALDWRMGLAVTLFILVMLVGYALVNMYLKPVMSPYGAANAAVSTAILTYVHGMKVIRAFSRSDREFASFGKAMREFGEKSEEIERKGMPAKTIAVLLSRTALLIIFPAGLWLYGLGQITVPVLIFFMLMSMGVGAALFKMLRSSAMTAFRISAAVKNVAKLLEEPELPPAAAPREPSSAEIAFRNVSFAYNDHEVLSDVSFTVPEGSMTALVGPSGAGKTTIARLLPRFWDVGEGAVTIGGEDVRNMGEDRLMSLISFVFQDAYLFQGSIMDNIRLGKPSATDEEVKEAARKAGCHDFIRSLPQGYDTPVGESGSALSGGQRQRISLVRAILKDAPIIVLDEATALVDPENEARIQDALSGLLRPADGAGRPKTILTIAHRLGTVVHADQIIVVDEGRIAATGTHAQLLDSSPLYLRMWEAYEAGAENVTTDREPLPARAAHVAYAEATATTTTAAAATATTAATAATAGAEATTAGATAEAAAPPASAFAASAFASSAPAAPGPSSGAAQDDDPYKRLGKMSMPRQAFIIAEGKHRELKWSYLFSLLEHTFAALGSLAVVLALHLLIEGRAGDAWNAVGLIAVLFALQAVFYYSGNRFSFPMYGHLAANLRLYLGDRLRKLPYGFFSVMDSSSLESRIKGDAQTYTFVPYVSIVLIKGIVVPAITFAGMLWIDWRLALAALVGIPLSVGATWLAERKLKIIVQQLNAARQQANSRILEYIRGINVIRSFSLAGERMRSYAAVIRQYRDASVNINKGLTPYMAVYGISFELGFCLVLIVGSQLVGGGSLAAGAFMIFLVLAICLYEPLPLMDYAIYRRMGHTTLNNLNDIIQPDNLSVPPADRRQLPAGHDIELREVTFGYAANDKPVLRGLTLTIPQRGLTALVGPSGGGKTTILNLIARFWDVQQGSVTIGGADVRGMHPDRLMEQLALVFQDVYLFNDTIAANIRYGNPDAGLEEVIEAAKAARCHDFIMKLPNGYDTVVGEGGGLLSGGQKQRVSIARAMLKDAPIILLDEATASIDPDNEQYIQEALEALSRNKTVVIIAHRLHTVMRADNIVVVDEGRIVQTGTHAELIGREGIYRTFWEERRRAQGWSLQRSGA